MGEYRPWQFKVEKYTVCDFEKHHVFLQTSLPVSTGSVRLAQRVLWKPTA